MKRLRWYLCATVATLALTVPAHSDEQHRLPFRPTLNTYGLPGLIDMPSAHAMPDGELGFTFSHAVTGSRGTLSFQVLPDVTATFRYAGIPDFAPGPGTGTLDVYYDRSFDLHWQVLDERGWRPALAIGIRDIAGTGVYGGEYIVATRHFGPEDRVAVSVGLGWGRLGERNGFTNPLGILDDSFETRPGIVDVLGGTLNTDQFFRGDAAIFGGIEWQASDRLRVQLEYSSDTYREETADGLRPADTSPFNIGATYAINDVFTGGAHVLGGDTFGLSLSLALNPHRPSLPPGAADPAPRPLDVRPRQSTPYDTGWLDQPGGADILRANFEQTFEDQGLYLEHLALDTGRATVRVRNTRYNYSAQALGRVLRAMSASLPPSVEVFEVIFVVEGMDTTRVRVARSDLEALEFHPDGSSLLLAGAGIEDARRVADPVGLELDVPPPRFTWAIGPYLETSVFDPENPFLFNVGVSLRAEYRLGGGFVAEGAIRAPLFGNLEDARIVNAPPPNPPPVVRSDSARYRAENAAYLNRLTLAHYGRPAENLYSRVTVGYLERMYAGVSGELLWQPAASRLGLGVEINHVRARAYDGGFGLRDYSVTTGHVSAYYRLNDDFDLQVDAGRYLAGDWGTTIRLDRTFNNGWRVGAFATFTDVSFESFGEGSFDKGIEVEIPLAWFVGTANTRTLSSTIRPVQRDGGARLNVQGRLHDLVTDYSRPMLQETEAMVWR